MFYYSSHCRAHDTEVQATAAPDSLCQCRLYGPVHCVRMNPCGQVFAERISRLDVLPARIVWLLTPSAARPHYALHERITLAARIESSHKRFDALAGAWRFEVPSFGEYESHCRKPCLALRGTLSRVSAAAIAANTCAHVSGATHSLGDRQCQ
jgi:hypothetical protein